MINRYHRVLYSSEDNPGTSSAFLHNTGIVDVFKAPVSSNLIVFEGKNDTVYSSQFKFGAKILLGTFRKALTPDKEKK